MRVRCARMTVRMTHRADDREVVGQRYRPAASPPVCVRAAGRARACVREAARRQREGSADARLAAAPCRGMTAGREFSSAHLCLRERGARARHRQRPHFPAQTQRINMIANRGRRYPHSPLPWAVAAPGTAWGTPGRGGRQGGGTARAALSGVSSQELPVSALLPPHTPPAAPSPEAPPLRDRAFRLAGLLKL